MGAPLPIKFPLDLWTVSDGRVLTFYMKYSPRQRLLQWRNGKKTEKWRGHGKGGGGGFVPFPFPLALLAEFPPSRLCSLDFVFAEERGADTK